MTTDRGDLDWAQHWIARQFGARLHIETMVQVPSRLARLHRVTLVGPDGRRSHAYLKRYVPEAAADWAERLSHMHAASAALDGTPGLLPLTILAADPAEPVLLTAELPGRPLTAWHRRALVSPAARVTVARSWHGTGRWLGRVHGAARPATASLARAADLADEIDVRLDRWAALDPPRQTLIEAARRTVRGVLARLTGPVTVVLCHGDISPGNILVDAHGVGLLDLDDLRMDMPGLDLSQARLAIEEFGHLGWPVHADRARTARWLQDFVDGYARPLPEGPDIWLPHLRNLAVFLLTLAGQREGAAPRRLAVELRYRRLLRELGHAISDVERGQEFWRRAG